jgi:ribosomal protein L24E
VRRLTPYMLLAVLTLGTGVGIGLGLSEAPVAGARHADGQIRGTVDLLVGGVEYHAHPGTGTVVVEQRGRVVRTVDVSSEDSFQISVAPGRYKVVVSSPRAECVEPSSFENVHAHERITLSLICVEPSAVG